MLKRVDDKMKELTITNNKGNKLAAWLYEGSKGKDELIIMFHGHPGDSQGGAAELAAVLNEAGHNVLRFDHRGCGNSEGDFSDWTIATAIDDGEAVLAWAKEEGYDKISLVGGSFGGNTALNIAVKHDIETMVLRAPAPDMTDESEVNMFSSMKEWKEQGHYMQSWTDDKTGDTVSFKIPYQFYLDAVDHIMFEASKDITCRTLIIHGNADDIVPLEQSQKLAENMPQALLVVLDGADHRLYIDGSKEEADKLTLEWFS